MTHLTARLHPRSYGFERELKERLERFAKLRAERNEQDLFRIAWQRRKFPGHPDKLSRLNRALKHIERAEPVLIAHAENKANGLAGGLSVSRER